MASRIEQLALKAEALELIGQRLRSLGLDGRSRRFGWKISGEFDGRLVLQVDLFASDSLADVFPHVGVWSRTVEALYRELMPDVEQRYATVQTPLSNLVPKEHLIDGRYSWGFQPSLDKPRVADHLAAEFREHGLPWAQSMASYERMLVEPRFGLAGKLQPRAAILQWLLGDLDGVGRELGSIEERYKTPRTDYGDRMLEFASGLRARIAETTPRQAAR